MTLLPKSRAAACNAAAIPANAADERFVSDRSGARRRPGLLLRFRPRHQRVLSALVGLLSAKVALGTAIGMFARFLMRLSSLPRSCCRKRRAGNFRRIEKIQLSLATS
jgi:hypothetical protein